MAKKKIEVEGTKISTKIIDGKEYFSITDIAKKFNETPSSLILAWLRNHNTLQFFEAWEKKYNANFNLDQMVNIRIQATENRNTITAKKLIEETGAISIISTTGRYGGTYAHKDVVLNFCYWVSPPFQVEMIAKFQELIEAEFQRKNLKWHITKITDRIEDVRNLLDTIPHQDENRKRIKLDEKNKK